MTKQEFEDRTGYHIIDERFKDIEAMYLEAGEDIDKDIFCDDYKKHADSILLHRFYGQSEKLKAKIDTLRTERTETARLLIREAAEYQSDSLRKQAIMILGADGYLREKIKLGIAFDCYDYELVTEFL